MITRRILLASLIMAAIALYSCDDDGTATGGTQVISMPNSVGMLWVYEVYDSLTQTTDTVSVSITDAVVEGLRWRVFWQAADSVSERIAVVRGDTLDFIIDTNFIAPPLERFVFPLSLGSQWNVPAPILADSSVVTDINTVSVKAGTFRSSALVERIWNFRIQGGHDSSLTWVAPNIGIVSRYLYGTIAAGPALIVTMNETWELIDYDLTTFFINQFPGAIGSEWVYEIIDSRFASPDTATVSVFKSVEIPGFDSTKMWLIQGSLISDTQYVAYVNNQVWVSGDTVLSSLFDWRYEFPLAVGRHWGLVTIGGAPMVTTKSSATTPAGTFPSAFNYTMSGGALNSSWSVNEWLVPGVGVVRRTYSVFDFIPFGYTQEWTLLSYDLK